MYSRRSIFQAASAFAAFVGLRSSAAIAGWRGHTHQAHQVDRIRWIEPGSFAELQEKIKALPNRQIDGPRQASFNGMEYKEIFHYAIARPGDEAAVEKLVAQQMGRDISLLFNDNIVDGVIVWRIPLETEVGPWSVVKEYCDDGPDMDWVTNRKCIRDKNWVRVAAYARLMVV